VGGDDALTLAIIALLLVCSGTFSAAEISFLALGGHRARRVSEGHLGKLVDLLLARPAITLGTLLMAITALNYSAEATAATWVLTDLRLPLWVAIVGMALAVLIFAEAIPISYAAANPVRVARVMVLPLWLASFVLLIPARAIGFLAERLVRLLGAAQPAKETVTEGEIKAILDLQAEGGRLEEEEKVMIHHIFAFGDKVAREVMVPRTDMVAAPAAATVEEAAQMASDHHISRLPVYRDSLDNVVGVIYVKDILPLLVSQQGGASVASVMRPTLRVPETRTLSDLMTDYRRQRRTVAIVVDEYGGTAGLVTMEDLLEEVVGDIYDEYDVVRAAIERLPDGSLRLDARMSVEEAAQVIGVALPEGEYDSLAGLLYSHLGVVPKAGQRVEVEGARLIAEEVRGHRIMRVRVIVAPKPEGEPGEGRQQ
jgi:CBS domain containing-hemolysin-like protein